MSRIPRLSLVLAPLLLYTVLAVVATWPLAVHFDTHIPGDRGDGPNFIWRLWWVPHALFTLHQSPWTTGLIFHPQQTALAFDTLVPLYGIASHPLQVLGGPVVAYNLLLLGSIAAAAWTAFLLVRGLAGGWAGPLLAGALFGFSPYMLAHVRGHLNLVAIWPLPLFALCLARALERGSARWAAGAGAALGVLSLIDYQNAVFALLLAVFAGLAIIRRPGPPLRPALRAGLWVVAVWLLVFAPLLFPALAAVGGGFSPAASLRDARFYSADLTAFLSPGDPQLARSGSPDFHGIGGIEGVAYVGWFALLLAALGAVRGRAPRATPGSPAVLGPGFWVACAAVFGLLALGPELHVNGQSTFSVAGLQFSVPLPYAVLHQVPLMNAVRVPSRFAVMVYLAVAVLAGYGVATLRRQPVAGSWMANFRSGALGFLLLPFAAGLAVDYRPPELPLRSVQAPAFYTWLASQPGDGALLTLPIQLAAGSGATVGEDQQLIQSYQTVHRRPVVNGHVARGPAALVGYYGDLPVLSWLLDPFAQRPAPEDLDPATFARAVGDLHLDYAVLHKRYYDAAGLDLVSRYFAEAMAQPLIWDDPDTLVFRLSPEPPAPSSFHASLLPVPSSFLASLEPGLSLLEPSGGILVSDEFPVLRWEPDDLDKGGSEFEVQLAASPAFTGVFLYHERIDGRLTDPPFSYRVPGSYPLDPATLYFWRVRRLAASAEAPASLPGPWSLPQTFRTPPAGAS